MESTVKPELIWAARIIGTTTENLESISEQVSSGNPQKISLDCSKLHGRLRQICEGTSGLAPEIEEAYRQKWAEIGVENVLKPPTPEQIQKAEIESAMLAQQLAASRNGIPPEDQGPPINQSETPCIHRGQLLETGSCDLCGIRGQPFEILSCAVHGTCSLYRRHSKVVACLTCGDFRQSGETEQTGQGSNRRPQRHPK